MIKPDGVQRGLVRTPCMQSAAPFTAPAIAPSLRRLACTHSACAQHADDYVPHTPLCAALHGHVRQPVHPANPHE